MTHPPEVHGVPVSGRMEDSPRDARGPGRILQATAHDEFGKTAAAVGERRGHEANVEDAVERHGEGRRHGMAVHIRDVPV